MRARLTGAFLPIFLVAAVAGAFILIDDTHDQTVGGIKTHVHPDIGQVSFATLSAATPADGELQYCTDCTENTNPCTGGGSGSLASRTNGAWVCFGSGIVAGATPTPLVFGTPGVIPVFASPELGAYAGAACPTPQVAQAISASGGLTCVSPAGGSCPAGSDTYIQFNDGGVCGGEATFVFNKTTPSVVLSSATDTKIPILQISSSVNSSGNGAGLWIRGAGTSQNSDLLVSFDRGVATGSVERYLNMGLEQSSGNFNFIDNSTPSDAHTGTAIMQFLRGATKHILIEVGAGSSSVTSLGFINADDTGWSYTAAAGGGGDRINTIVNGTTLTYHEVTNGAANRFGIEYTTVLTPDINNALTGAGPTEVTVNRTLQEYTTNNGAGTAICPNNTNITEGQLLKIVNNGSNDLTIAETNTATCKVHTTGGATQTLANALDNIEFINLGGFWVQSSPVQGP